MKFLTLVLLSTLPLSAAAQSLPECKGYYEIIRTDDVKPGKTSEFMKAVTDHQAWFKAHRLPDRIEVAQVVTLPGQGGPAFAADKFVTIRVAASVISNGTPDDAWNAFVAEYKDSSTITGTQIICVLDAGK